MYSFDSRIRYSEVDEEQKLRLVSLLDYFQDCSTFQADDLDISMDYLKTMDLAWVLNCWQIDVERYPREGEKVTIATNPYKCQSFLGYRNYAMFDAAGNRIAVANTIWTMLNMVTGKPADIPEKVIKAYEVSEKLDMDYLPRKVKVAAGLVPLVGDPLPVRRSDIDFNRHVNNAQYIRMVIDCLPQDLHDAVMPASRLRVEYARPAHLGDVMVPHIYKLPEGGAVVRLQDASNPDGVGFATVELTRQVRH